MAAFRSTISRLGPSNLSKTVLFVCDIQDRFRPLIHNCERVIFQTKLMYDATRVLNIPCIVTEHYAKALGPTVPDLYISSERNTFTFQKKKFSMLTPEVNDKLRALVGAGGSSSAASDLAHTKVLLCGIEAHVCILQTALDLMEAGASVHIICDSVSSQREYDRKIALERLSNSGAILTTTESVLFELMGDADHAKFKEVSGLLKVHNEQVKLLAPQDFI